MIVKDKYNVLIYTSAYPNGEGPERVAEGLTEEQAKMVEDALYKAFEWQRTVLHDEDFVQIFVEKQ